MKSYRILKYQMCFAISIFSILNLGFSKINFDYSQRNKISPVQFKTINQENYINRFNKNFKNEAFCTVYPKECIAFFKVFNQNQEIWKKIVNRNEDYEIEFLISIVSPEISFYSLVSDKFETFGNEAFYVEIGSGYADFSIGLFQMKPSFIEIVEKKIRENAFLFVKYKALCHYDSDEKTNRRSRLTKMKNMVTQFEYLCAFYDLMEMKYGNTIKDKKEKLRFYAASYNIGFYKTETYIKQILSKPLFPSKILTNKKKFQYSKIAEMFYKALIKRKL